MTWWRPGSLARNQELDLRNYVFKKCPISFGLLFNKNKIVKLFIVRAVCERIAGAYIQLLLKYIKMVIIFPLIFPLFTIHLTRPYFWTCFIMGFERDECHDLDSNFYINESSNIFKIRLFSTNADFIFDNHVQLTQLFTSSALLAQIHAKDFTTL